MTVSGLTRIRTLPPWRESSARVVPDYLPLHPAQLQPDDRAQTKIWDALELLNSRNVESNAAEARAASVGCWFIYAPWMHMVWAWHYCGLVHLRPVPGQSRQPVKKFPQATHEFLVFALDPTVDVIAERLRPLTPVSIVQQFDAANDAHARLIVEDILEEVAKGRVSVDSDFRRVWQHLLCECSERPPAP